MSGEVLRGSTILNKQTRVKRLLAAGSNPCSVDEYGLTALHYAIWGDYEELARILVANHRGIDHEGNRASCLNQQSDAGFTPLHIACMDDVHMSLDFIQLLIFMRCERELVDSKNRRPEDLTTREDIRHLLQTFYPSEEGKMRVMEELMAEHCVQVPDKGKVNIKISSFQLPEFVVDPQERLPSKALELAIHEEHILPFARLVFYLFIILFV